MNIYSDGLPGAEHRPNQPNQPTDAPVHVASTAQRPIAGLVARPADQATGPHTSPENSVPGPENVGSGQVGPVGPALHTRGGQLAFKTEPGMPSPSAAARWCTRPSVLAVWLVSQHREHQDRARSALERAACSATACSTPTSTGGGQEHAAA